MYTRLKNSVIRHLEKHDILQNNDIRLYIITMVALLFCFVAHVYLLVTYLLFHIPAFVWLNIGSLTVYCVLLMLHRRRLYKPLALLLSAEVILYATITIWLMGIGSYVVGYYLLVVILQVILPYDSVRKRTQLLLVILVVGAPGIVYGLMHEPLIPTPQNLHFFLTLSNIYILFIGTVVQLYLSNIVQEIIMQYSQTRVDNLSVLANADPLTGLFNRRYAEDYFGAIGGNPQNKPSCIAMLDIDNFKQVNDTLGHPCGDEVLVFLADFLTANLRHTDIVFRWGGEEFLLVLENVDLPTAYIILEMLRARLAGTSIPTSAGSLRITVTMGITTLDSTDPMRCIQLCDQNLYTGKHRGKNIVIAH